MDIRYLEQLYKKYNTRHMKISPQYTFFYWLHSNNWVPRKKNIRFANHLLKNGAVRCAFYGQQYYIENTMFIMYLKNCINFFKFKFKKKFKICLIFRKINEISNLFKLSVHFVENFFFNTFNSNATIFFFIGSMWTEYFLIY